jgi:uncharacterized protein YbjT (DUF2867 family)
VPGAASPWTIVRATQFFEFLASIAGSGTADGAVRLPSALFQPVAADDVASTLADVVLAPPVDGIVELAGPEPAPMADLVRSYLAATGDEREVIGDPHARYFGAELDDAALTPGEHPRLGSIRYADWQVSPAGRK